MDSDDSWRTLMPVPLHVQVYAAILARPTLASALLAIPLAVPMYFLFPIIIDFGAVGLGQKAWYSLPLWWRFFLTWFSHVVTLQLFFRRPY